MIHAICFDQALNVKCKIDGNLFETSIKNSYENILTLTKMALLYYTYTKEVRKSSSQELISAARKRNRVQSEVSPSTRYVTLRNIRAKARE